MNYHLEIYREEYKTEESHFQVTLRLSEHFANRPKPLTRALCACHTVEENLNVSNVSVPRDRVFPVLWLFYEDRVFGEV